MADLLSVPNVPNVPNVDEELDEEEESRILGSVMGGMEAIGNIIDTPRAMFWELVQGRNPLAVANPFNREAVKARTTGWDLTEKLGLPQAGEEAGLLERIVKGIPSLATEIAFDPVTYLTLGAGSALTQAGKSAQKAASISKSTRVFGKSGKMGKAVRQFGRMVEGKAKKGRLLGLTPLDREREIREGLRGIAAIKIPFVEKPLHVFGAGSDRAADLYHTLHYGKYSPITLTRSLMSPIVGGVEMSFKTPRGVAKDFEQLGMLQHDAAFSYIQNLLAARNDYWHAARVARDEISTLWDSVGKYAQTLPAATGAGPGRSFNNVDDFLTYIGQLQPKIGDPIEVTSPSDIMGLFSGVPGRAEGKVRKLARKSHELMESLRQMNLTIYEELPKLGANAELLDEWSALHVARHVHPKASREIDVISRIPLHKYRLDEAMQRRAMFKIPGSTSTLNAMARDELLTASDTLPVATDSWFGKPSRKNWAKIGDYVVIKEKGIFGRVLGLNGDKVVLFARDHNGVIRSSPIDISRLAPVTAGSLDNAIDAVGRNRTIWTKQELQARLEAEVGADWIQENTLVQGEAITAPTVRDMQVEYFRRKYFEPELQSLVDAKRIDPERAEKWYDEFFVGTEKKRAKARGLIRYLARRPDFVREEGLFNRALLDDWVEYQEHAAMAYGNLLGAHSLLQQVAKNVLDFPQYIQGDKIRYGDILNEQGYMSLNQAWGMTRILRPGGKRPIPALTDEGRYTAIREYLGRLHATNPSAHRALVGRLDLNKADSLDLIGNKILVDSRLPDVLTKYVQLMSPDHHSALGQLYDSIQGAFRYWVTIPFVAHMVRNLGDGLWRGIARIGGSTYSAKDYFGALKEVLRLNAKRAAEVDIEKDLKYGAEFLRERTGWTSAEAVLGTGKDMPMPAFSIKQVLLGNPKQPKQVVPEIDLDLIVSPTRRRIAKLKGIAADVAKPFKKLWLDPARRAYEYAEFVVRYPIFAAARKAGMSPSQAAALVREIEYDYSRLPGGELPSSFGNRVMRRLYPFWSFVSRNIPYQISQIFHHPGGGHAQTLRIFSRAREGWTKEGEENYVPRWLREQTGIRLGGPEEEAKFVRSFGLSMESALGLPVFERGVPLNLRTLEKSAADLSPLAQMPIRLLTKRDIYSGRPIAHLAGPTGIESIDKRLKGGGGIVPTILRATPLARGLGTVAMLADERKTPEQKLLSALTGVKIGMYNLPQQKLMEAEDAIKRILEMDPMVRQYTQHYVPKAKLEEVSEATLRRLKLLESLERQRRALLAQDAAK